MKFRNCGEINLHVVNAHKLKRARIIDQRPSHTYLVYTFTAGTTNIPARMTNTIGATVTTLIQTVTSITGITMTNIIQTEMNTTGITMTNITQTVMDSTGITMTNIIQTAMDITGITTDMTTANTVNITTGTVISTTLTTTRAKMGTTTILLHLSQTNRLWDNRVTRITNKLRIRRRPLQVHKQAWAAISTAMVLHTMFLQMEMTKPMAAKNIHSPR
ncbi:MAG: hypothetical protein JST44_07525 [Cyanobacteria bacterium SZAS LIN-5]|nr:hypothetical protein [Cyanobacteria bacterium SZAS LIN-5]